MTAVGDREESYTGTPAGGILSPLLANIALSALDDLLHPAVARADGHQVAAGKAQAQRDGRVAAASLRRRLGHPGQRRPCPRRALREEAAAVLAPLGLQLAEEKQKCPALLLTLRK